MGNEHSFVEPRGDGYIQVSKFRLKAHHLVGSAYAALIASLWFSLGPWLILSVIRHGVVNPLGQESEPTSVDNIMAWANGVGGLSLHFLALLTGLILFAAGTRKYRFHATLVLFAFVAVTILGLSMTGRQAQFDPATMHFQPL